ncbi:unnamed protein product [Adineta ricciae]|uniref:Uncharacterized protein n=1 Tax=Adineta ricciae TaxID=249248 RepID=A0A813QWY9_ADIRI|nr:unnamed protein product [Adineta ricciae]
MALSFITNSTTVSAIRSLSSPFVKQPNSAVVVASSTGPTFLKHQTHRRGTPLSDKSSSSLEYEHLPPLTHPSNAVFRHYQKRGQPSTYGFQLNNDISSPPVSNKNQYVPKTMNTTTTIKKPANGETTLPNEAGTPRRKKKTSRESHRQPRRLWWSPKRNHIEIRSEDVDHYYNASSKVGSLDNLDYRSTGGQISIRDEPVKWQAQSKIRSFENIEYRPSGGQVSIRDEPVTWQAQSKIRSFDNIDYRPSGGQVSIRDEPVTWQSQSKIRSLDNIDYRPSGGQISIRDEPVAWQAQSKVGSLDNVDYRPSGGQVSIRDEPLRWHAQSKVDSLSNANWTVNPSRVAIRSERVQWNAESKVGSMMNMDYRPAGGDVAIRDDRMDLSHVTPRVDCGFIE